MKKISKVVTASALLFTLVNPLEVFAEGNVTNISTTSENKVTQDVVVNATEVNGEVVFEVTAVKDTYDTVLHATVDGKKFTYNLGNLKKGQVSKVVQAAEGKEATISKENKGPKALPNTSTVRQLVEKEVNYNNNVNGKVIEAKVVYKTYELVEVNDGTSTAPVAKPGESNKPKPPVAAPGEGNNTPKPPVAAPGEGNKPTTPPGVKPQPQPTPPGDGNNTPKPPVAEPGDGNKPTTPLEVTPQPQPTPPGDGSNAPKPPVATPGDGNNTPKPPVAEPGDGNKPTTPPGVKPQPQPTPPGDGSNQPQPTPPVATPGDGNNTPKPPVVDPGDGNNTPKPPVAEPGDGNKPTTPPEMTPQPQPTPPGDGSNQPKPTPSGVTKINSEVTKADPGNVIVGLKGEFDTPNKDAILAEINRIRKEAVDQGLADKYVPIKWSTDLEKTALVRAAEASITVGQHARLTNKNIWTAYPDRVGSENLAWNNSGINKAIQQWYGEKADFIKKKNGAAVSGQTGHYKSLIDPQFTHMGIAAFRNSKAPYGGVTAAQALASSGNSESLVGTYGKAVLYTEATESKLPEYKQKADLEQN